MELRHCGRKAITFPIIIGTIPFDGSTSAMVNPPPLRVGTVPNVPPIAYLPSAPPLPMFEPPAPDFPDDDSISIRTYASTPPPFPDDNGKYFHISIIHFTRSLLQTIIIHLFILIYRI